MTTCDVLIIGGGPAGLRAAELVSAAGWKTVLADRMPSVGRKFLIAGRGGLNLTHSEPVENFPARYGDPRWKDLLADFSPADLRAWAEGLGIETFVGTSGRVFPVKKQAAPLLRRWVERLRAQGVVFRLRHKLIAFRLDQHAYEVQMETPQETVTLRARAIILALGGASWPQTGSDGSWTRLLSAAQVEVAPLTPANCGYEVSWPAALLAQAEGLPLKNLVVRAGTESFAGELLITSYGLEGGALYQLGRALRTMERPELIIDFKPTFSSEELLKKIPPKQPLSPATAAKAWKLSDGARALLEMHAPFSSWEELTALAKAYPLTLTGPRPIAEAISTAGGIAWSELDDHLMLRRHPGLFCAGEMIDWEAPTGGYLLQGCFATATRAARSVNIFLNGKQTQFPN